MKLNPRHARLFRVAYFNVAVEHPQGLERCPNCEDWNSLSVEDKVDASKLYKEIESFCFREAENAGRGYQLMKKIMELNSK